MVSRRNLDALAKLGARRRQLAAELTEVDTAIDKNLARTYLEGWTWEELRKASSLSQGPLANRLRKLGLTKRDNTRPRFTSQRRPVGKYPTKAPQGGLSSSIPWHENVRVDGRMGGPPNKFGGLLSWIPHTS
ncbi:hypothetical protein NVV99_24340 [Rhodococcus sp. PAE-6]|uniref:hypothetical protein n=1 Tax=Rhodococcus sp. PAE-6 TaxID=2972477 RepID=UPI0021B31646|nr:hypothetical protein [Rhodococcus sp. PAE-6]MCT7294031.1 hypothetical protein [Rhodococcus sp. PAE-6]